MQQARKSARQRKRELQVKRIKRTMITVAVTTVAGIMAAAYCTALTYTKPEPEPEQAAEITTEAVELVDMQPVTTVRVNDPDNDIYPYNTISRDWGAGDLDGFVYYKIPESYSMYGGCLPEIVQIYTYCTCKQYEVDYATILAMIEAESGYQWDATADDATGYMQIIPEYHKDRMNKIGVQNVDNPYQNIRTGVDCVAELLKKYQNNYHKALTAYRWGPTGAERNYFSKKKYTCEYAEAVLEKASRIKRELEQEQ